MRTLQRLLRACSLAVAGLALGISPAWPAEFWLEARPMVPAEFPAEVPATIPMWGYASCDSAWTCGPASVPGPQLVVPAGDTSGLTVHLKNSLPATTLTVPNMTSLVIPGQRDNAMVPVMFPAEPNPHDGGVSTRVRMRSFTHETAQGTIGDYVWPNLRPGTYLYHSGTHVQVQVQMGLYGSVKADAATGQAYAGQTYDSEATLLFSEIDPALHAEVANGTYGTPGHPSSTILFHPTYFLLNGAPYSASTAAIAAGQAGQRVLLRLLNAGIESHVATLLGGRFQVIAEDGNLLAHPRDQYETLLPAAKTIDAIWVPATTGTYSLYDRRNRQGMLAKLNTVTVAGNQPPIANADLATVAEDGSVTISVLANDSDPDVPAQPLSITAVTQGTNGIVTNNGTTVTYKPNANFNGADSFTYTVSDGQTPTPGTAVGTVNVTVTPVNDAPVAVADVYAVNKQTTFTVPATGVLVNDSDVDGTPLTAIANSTAGGRVSLNADGSFTYTTTASYVGTRTFRYHANDGSLNSNVVNVTLRKDLTVTSIGLSNNGNNWVIRGRSTTPNSTVTVYLGPTTAGTVLGTATVSRNGSWRLNVSTALYPTLTSISAQSSTGAEVIDVTP